MILDFPPPRRASLIPDRRDALPLATTWVLFNGGVHLIGFPDERGPWLLAALSSLAQVPSSPLGAK
jgi:hypothetical protein